MERTKWNFPEPFNKKKISQDEEYKIFIDLADQFSKLINREVKINNGKPPSFKDLNDPDCNIISILYSADPDFQLTISLLKKKYLYIQKIQAGIMVVQKGVYDIDKKNYFSKSNY